MHTNRELYFYLLNKKSKYLTDYVIKLLICNVNGYNGFTELSLKMDEEIKDKQLCNSYIEQLLSGKPYQYVMHEAFFMDDVYYVDENVLIPRQETEQLIIEILKKIEDLQSFCPNNICDLCTGSGILGIELKKRFPESRVVATDIDESALKVAEFNANNKGLHIVFKKGNMVEAILDENKFDLLISNPPYIDDITTIDEQAFKYEPHKALLAFPDTFFYEEIFKKLLLVMKDKFIAGFEIGENQKSKLEDLVYKYFKNINFEFKIDLYGKTRFLLIWKN